jgi:hypothetical protein
LLTLFPYIGQPQFAAVLDAWFTKQSLLENVCDLFFGVVYNNYLYLRFQFLGLVQALETYCRSVQHGQYVSESAYEIIKQALIAAIPATTPQDLRNSLKMGKIEYGNEYSLRKRLRLLLCSLEDNTVRMITDNPGQFSEQVTATRNYYTHYTSTLQSQAFAGAELFRACLRLRVLLTIVLLKEIDLEESLIRQIWENVQNHSQLADAVRSAYTMY